MPAHKKGSTWVQILDAVTHATFYYFSCVLSFFIRMLLRHVTLYNMFIYVFYYNYIL